MIGISRASRTSWFEGIECSRQIVSGWYSPYMVTLSDDEARDLVRTILEAIEAAEEGTQVRAS